MSTVVFLFIEQRATVPWSIVTGQAYVLADTRERFIISV